MESYFRTTSYALIGTSVLALALTGNVDLFSISLYVVAWGICYWRDSRNARTLRLREWMWRVLAVLYVPFVFFDAAVLTGNRVTALVHMTLFLSAVKLMQDKRDRDWVFLYLIAFFQMLLAAGLTFNAIFVGSLAMFLFFFVSTLAAFEIRRATAQVRRSTDETITRRKPSRRLKKLEAAGRASRTEPRVRYFVGASAGQIALVAVLTLPLFFLIPRLGGGGAVRSFGDSNPITGFSEHVELGNVAHLKTSPRVVMRVQLDRPPSKYIRWRGVTLDRYEDKVWSATTKHYPTSALSGGSVNGQVLPPDARIDRSHIFSGTSGGEVLLTQRIVLEPLATPVLFAASRPLVLRGPIGIVQLDRFTGKLTAEGLTGRVPYSVISDIGQPSPDQLRASSPASAPEEIKEVYLQTPRLDSRIPLLVHEITRNEINAYDKARAIETYLKTQFKYTLDLKAGGKDPLAEFLFDLKEGHCEYFATAMVMMLRTIGIPARIVNGFQMGEYNELSDYYTVRESDAHSWVEAYFPSGDAPRSYLAEKDVGRGWIEFDPTPSAGINDYSKGGLVSRLRKYADAMEVFWLDYVVTLDRDQQASIMVELQHRLLEIKDWAQAKYLALKEWARRMVEKMPRDWGTLELIELLAMAVAVGAIVLLVYVRAAHRKRRVLPPTGYGPWWHRFFVLPTWKRKIREGDHMQSAVLFYEQMLFVAQRAGLTKSSNQTPLEFASASGLSQISEITSFYNRVRFGGSQLGEDDARRVSTLLAELRQRIKRRH